MLNISAYFLSQKRLNEVLPPETLAPTARFFDISEPANRGLSRTAVVGAYESAAIDRFTVDILGSRAMLKILGR